jgi:hypothetical protein
MGSYMLCDMESDMMCDTGSRLNACMQTVITFAVGVLVHPLWLTGHQCNLL